MEFLILGTLAMLGRQLSNSGNHNITKSINSPKQQNAYPITSDNLPREPNVNDIPTKQSNPQLNYNVSSNPNNLKQNTWSVSGFGNELDPYATQHVFVGHEGNTPKVYDNMGIQGMTGSDAFHNNMVPFFKSDKTQNTNEDFKERRLESFTGSNNLEYTRKRETKALFEPTKGVSNIQGMKPQNNKERLERYIVTDKMNNVSPVEKQYVGPGLNVGSDVKVKGGYHDMFRILPNNVGSYKKNNFAGRVIPGKAINNTRNFQPESVTNNKPERYYSQESRPVLPQAFETKSSAPRGEYYVKNNNRGNTSGMSSLNATASLPPRATTTRTRYTKEYDNEMCTKHIVAPHSQNSGAGGYNVSKFLVSEGERENCGTITNAHINSGTIHHNNQILDPTVRDTTQYNTKGGGSVHRNTHGMMKSAIQGYTPDTTVRDTTQHNIKGGGNIGMSNLNASGHTTTSYDAPVTFREGTSVEYGGVAYYGDGPSNRKYEVNMTSREGTSKEYQGHATSSTVKAVSSYDSAKNADAYHKKEDSLIGHMPGPTNINVRSDAHDIVNNVEFKGDENMLRCNDPKPCSQVPDTSRVGDVELANKNIENGRLDFGMIGQQLQSNPYVNKPIKY